MIFDTGWKSLQNPHCIEVFVKCKTKKNAQTTAKKPKWNFGPNPKSGG